MDPRDQLEAPDRAALGPGPHTKVRRLPERARYDRGAIAAVLDEGLICHLAVDVNGLAIAMPMTYGRVGEALYLHGAVANAALRAIDGQRCAVTVTLLDALVLAKSTFHHSINYRSVVAIGRARSVVDPEEKRTGLAAIVEHIIATRATEARPPNDRELRATRLVRFDIEEASLKTRSGGPNDDAEDAELAVWAGELPLPVVPQAPRPSKESERLPIPPSLVRYGKSHREPQPAGTSAS
ncbi:MAG: pyridoxamine 5'-phosphate oxidase family protein [Actinomycetota bacterium]|nr:pyridoxamine 5'-phosphate oxidase family protein [Actinomycetota bacterium]